MGTLPKVHVVLLCSSFVWPRRHVILTVSLTYLWTIIPNPVLSWPCLVTAMAGIVSASWALSLLGLLLRLWASDEGPMCQDTLCAKVSSSAFKAHWAPHCVGSYQALIKRSSRRRECSWRQHWVSHLWLLWLSLGRVWRPSSSSLFTCDLLDILMWTSLFSISRVSASAQGAPVKNDPIRSANFSAREVLVSSSSLDSWSAQCSMAVTTQMCCW